MESFALWHGKRGFAAHDRDPVPPAAGKVPVHQDSECRRWTADPREARLVGLFAPAQLCRDCSTRARTGWGLFSRCSDTKVSIAPAGRVAPRHVCSVPRRRRRRRRLTAARASRRRRSAAKGQGKRGFAAHDWDPVPPAAGKVPVHQDSECRRWIADPREARLVGLFAQAQLCRECSTRARTGWGLFSRCP